MSTVVQAKLEAVKNGAQFRKVMGEIGASAGVQITMVKGRINPETGLLEKCDTGDDDDVDATVYYFISKRGFRMAQKVWIRGNVNTICDVNRALMEASSFEHMLSGAKAFFDHPDVEILEIKVRSLNWPVWCPPSVLANLCNWMQPANPSVVCEMGRIGSTRRRRAGGPTC